MDVDEFQAKCLSVIDKVQKTKRSVIITQRNVPIAQVVPIEQKKSIFGCMKGTVKIKKDIIESQWVPF